MAQSVEISRSRGGSTLLESVSTRLDVEPEHIAWDAYRTDDARWIVTAHHDGRLLGTWSFEAVGRTVHPQDESARALMGGGPSSVTSAPMDANVDSLEPKPEPEADPAPSSREDEVLESTTDPADVPDIDHPRPRLVSVTSDPLATERDTIERDATESDAERPDAEQAALLEQSDVTSTPKRAKRTKGKKGRASVPSWDEILFGASRPED